MYVRTAQRLPAPDRRLLAFLLAALAPWTATSAMAQETDQEDDPAGAQDLAKQLSNPIASLISVPIQNNLDFDLGATGDGWRSTTNVQPVVPVSISDDWNMISRTILPITYQDDVSAPGESEFGLGDVVQSIFFSPKEVGESGIIWGAGPVFLIPTATSGPLGGKKWGVGPTAVVLKQSGQLTVGMLANHIWSFAGSSARSDVSATFLQPFVSYTNSNATTFSFNTETTYDWQGEQWQVPLNVAVSQLTSIGEQPVQLGVGARYYLEAPDAAPDWGLRFVLTFLFPKG